MGACMLSVGTCSCLSCASGRCVCLSLMPHACASRLPHVPAFQQFVSSTGRIGFQERLVNGRELPRSWALVRRRQVGLNTLSRTTTGSPLLCFSSRSMPTKLGIWLLSRSGVQRLVRPDSSYLVSRLLHSYVYFAQVWLQLRVCKLPWRPHS